MYFFALTINYNNDNNYNNRIITVTFFFWFTNYFLDNFFSSIFRRNRKKHKKCLQSFISSLDRIIYWSDEDSLECPFKLGWAPPLWSPPLPKLGFWFKTLRIAMADGFVWCIYILSPSHSLSLYCRTFLCFSYMTRHRWHPFLEYCNTVTLYGL